MKHKANVNTFAAAQRFPSNINLAKKLIAVNKAYNSSNDLALYNDLYETSFDHPTIIKAIITKMISNRTGIVMISNVLLTQVLVLVSSSYGLGQLITHSPLLR
jgi:hypothetical protein